MEPVFVSTREIHVAARVHVECRRDVDDAQALHAFRVVEGESVRHPAAAVVAAQIKAPDAEPVEQADDVRRHGSLAVAGVVGAIGGGR